VKGKKMFQKATRAKSKLRLALDGPSGSGKTMTALILANHLGEKIAVIDTEHGSASKYADETAPDGTVLSFDVVELSSFSPDSYIKCIEAAKDYDVLIIDSLSHAWFGKDGVLEIVDQEAAKSRSGNTFVAWRKGSPAHHKLVEAILQAPTHVIVTMRTKTEYAMENVNGKMTPKKIGLAPVQRDGVEYEFDIVGDMDLENKMIVSKSRYSALSGQVIDKPTGKLAQEILSWLNKGDDPKLIQTRNLYAKRCEQAKELGIEYDELNGQNLDQIIEMGKVLHDRIDDAIAKQKDKPKEKTADPANDKPDSSNIPNADTDVVPDPETDFINNWRNQPVKYIQEEYMRRKAENNIPIARFWEEEKQKGAVPPNFVKLFSYSPELALKLMFRMGREIK